MKRIFLLALLTFSTEYIHAQLDTLGIMPKEDLFVEINRSFFIPGEELRISIVNKGVGSFELSRIVYVELVDQNNTPVLQEKLAMKNGQSEGIIYLPSILKSGQYTLLAYTKWMKNFDLQEIVQRKINVLNPFANLPHDLFITEIKNDSVYLQLFPEGGEFYHNSKQTVGYMIKNSEGDLVVGNIQIKDEKSETILDIQSELGYGSFVMTPTTNATYTVTIIDQMDQIHFTRFETQHTINKVTSFSQNEEFIDWKLWSEDQNLTLFVWHKGAVVLKIPFDQKELQLSKKRLPKGLITVQIQDSNENILYQRVVFNEPTAIEITATLDQQTYHTRKTATLSLKTDIPVDATLLVRKKYSLGIQDNAVANFFLSNHYPLLHTSWPQHKVDQNEWLLSDLNSNSENKFQQTITLPDFRGELIQGVLMDNKKPVPNHHFYITVVGEGETIFSTSTNSQGEFDLSVSIEKSGNQLIFSDIKDYKVEIQSPFLGSYEMVKNHRLQIDKDDLEDWLIPMTQQVQIKNLYSDTPTRLSKSDILFQKEDLFTYNFDDFHRFPTMSDHIIEYVAQVEMHQSDNQKYFYVRNLKNRSGEYNKVMTTLNGIYYNFEDFLKIDPLKIQKLAIYSSQFQLGIESYTGAIELISFPDFYNDRSIHINANSFTHKKVQEYQKNMEELSNTTPDMRTTLLWETNYTISNRQDCIFETSAVPGTYEIIIYGIYLDRYFYKLIEFEILDD